MIKSLAKENQTLLEKFVAWVRNIIDKINDFVMVNATAVDFNKAQLKAFQDGFLKLVGDLVNNDGKRIFIVRANGDIVLAGNGYKVEDHYELEPQITFYVKNSIDNNAKADNNVLESINENSKKSLNNKEKDMIFNSVKDRTVSEIKRMQKIFKNNEKVKTLLNEEKSIAREHVVQQFLHLYNMFHSPKVNKKSLVERYCGEESCKNKTREEIENKFEEIKTKVKDVLDYARFTYKQTVKMAGNGRGHDGVCNEYSSWTEMERVSQHVERRENEGIGTSSTGNEKNIEGIKSLNHSENQGGFSMPEDKTKYSINDNG